MAGAGQSPRSGPAPPGFLGPLQRGGGAGLTGASVSAHHPPPQGQTDEVAETETRTGLQTQRQGPTRKLRGVSGKMVSLPGLFAQVYREVFVSAAQGSAGPLQPAQPPLSALMCGRPMQAGGQEGRGSRVPSSRGRSQPGLGSPAQPSDTGSGPGPVQGTLAPAVLPPTGSSLPPEAARSVFGRLKLGRSIPVSSRLFCQPR